MRAATLFAFVLGFVGWLNAGRIFGGVGGPFRVEPKRVESCPPDMNGQGLITFTPYIQRVRNMTNTFKFTGNATFGHDLDDKYSAYIVLSSWSIRGGWKTNAFIVNLPKLCSILDIHARRQWRVIAKASFGYIPDCPIGKGFLHLEDTPVDFNIDGVSHFIYGKWRVDLQAVDENKNVLSCFRVYVDTVPYNLPIGAG